MQRNEPVDLTLEKAVLSLTQDWPTPRAMAALTSTGWAPGANGPAPLASAAQISGLSRESVRRARDRLYEGLRTDPQVRGCAEVLSTYLTAENPADAGPDSSQAGARATLSGMVSSPERFALAVETLTSAGLLAPGTGRAARDATFDMAAAVRAELADGRPRGLEDLTEKLGSAPLAVQVAVRALVDDGRARRLAGAGSSGTWIVLDDPDSTACRAVRRLVTMTGPLPWADLLTAWASGGGRPPHRPLPTNVDVLTAWLAPVPGLSIRASDALGGQPVVEAVDPPVDLDRTSDFLLRAIGQRPGGLGRAELLEAATRDGLRPANVAAALTYHPAVRKVGRGQWALRTSPDHGRDLAALVGEQPPVVAPRRARYRPVTFTWAPDGQLLLEFSAPSGPSPVLAVPSAVAPMLEGRELPLSSPPREVTGTLVIRGARAWGFGPLMRDLGTTPGQRLQLSCDLVVRTATLITAPPRKDTR